MYNTELKQRYIKEKEADIVSPVGYLKRIFEKSAPFEETLGKDLYNFTTYEIVNLYKTLNMNSLDSLYVMNSSYSQYEQWCLQQNLVTDCQNHFLELNRQALSQYVNKIGQRRKIVTRKEVNEWTLELPNYTDSFVIVCFFEGINGKCHKEITYAKLSDLRGNKFTTCTGRVVPVSELFVDVADAANDELTYQAMRGEGLKVIKLFPSEYIINEYPNNKDGISDFQKGRRVYNKLTRALEFLGVADYINGNDILVSGMIDMAQRESEKYNLSFKDYVYSKHFDDLEKKYDKKPIKSNFIAQYGSYFD